MCFQCSFDIQHKCMHSSYQLISLRNWSNLSLNVVNLLIVTMQLVNIFHFQQKKQVSYKCFVSLSVERELTVWPWRGLELSPSFAPVWLKFSQHQQQVAPLLVTTYKSRWNIALSSKCMRQNHSTGALRNNVTGSFGYSLNPNEYFVWAASEGGCQAGCYEQLSMVPV